MYFYSYLLSPSLILFTYFRALQASGCLTMSTADNWACNQCTLHNHCTSTKCAACSHKKDSPPTCPTCPTCSFKLGKAGEVCVKCELLNGVNIPVKRVVGLDKRLQGDPNYRQFQLQCQVCTFINRPGTSSCQMCRSQLAQGHPGKRKPMGTVRYKHAQRHQRTILGEELRRTANTEALALWRNIQASCKKVKLTNNAFQQTLPTMPFNKTYQQCLSTKLTNTAFQRILCMCTSKHWNS